jgi:hypothetical protein
VVFGGSDKLEYLDEFSDLKRDGTIFLSSLTDPLLPAGFGFRLDGISAGGETGHSVSSAGDVTGDGIDDLIIGAPGGNATYVVFGKDTATAGDFLSVLNLDGR